MAAGALPACRGGLDCSSRVPQNESDADSIPSSAAPAAALLMLIIPAIDLKDGKCVRLKQGVMSEATVFSEDPGAMAEEWVKKGARRLHVIDLNGAAAGKPKN